MALTLHFLTHGVALASDHSLGTGAQAGVGVALSTYVCSSEENDATFRHFGGSPLAFVAGEFGIAFAHLFVEAHSAPILTYGGGACHSVLLPLAMGAVGLWFGSDEFRMGPYGSAGMLAMEVGGRLAVTPVRGGGERAYRGVEVRGAWMGDRAAMVAAVYSVAWR